MTHGAPDWTQQIEVTINLGQPANERAINSYGSVTTTSSSYQTVKSWTVASGYIGVLTAVEMSCDNFPVVNWKLVVGSITVFEDKVLPGDLDARFPELRLAAGAVVTLSAKSDGSTEITAYGNFDAKEVVT